MVEIASISAAVTGLKTATDIAKTLMDLKSAAERQTKVIELQGVILSAQSSAMAAQSDQFTLLETVRDLEKKIAGLEAWGAEQQRYELTDFGGGTFAYVLKPEMSNGDPPHRICAACYQKGHKSILQFQYQAATGQDKHTCPECKTEFLFGVRGEPPVIRRGPRGGSWMGR